MKKEIIFSFALIIFGGHSFSQSMQLNKKGIIVFNKPSFKQFAILMQDTTLSGNRFDNWFDAPEKNGYLANSKGRVTLPALIIDSALFFKCEERLLNPDSTVEFYSYPNYPNNNDRLRRNVKKYIRLYIGYIDSYGYKNVVVQFLKPREFKKMEYIYNKQLFLVAKQKRLRFAVIQFCAKNF